MLTNEVAKTQAGGFVVHFSLTESSVAVNTATQEYCVGIRTSGVQGREQPVAAGTRTATVPAERRDGYLGTGISLPLPHLQASSWAVQQCLGTCSLISPTGIRSVL